MRFLFSLSVPLLSLAAGCSALGLGSPPCPPSWALQPPADATWAMGVGQSGATYLPQDARDLSLARAVNELAAQAGITIESESLLLQKIEGGRYIEQWTQQINSRIEGLIEGFEIVERHDCFAGGQHRQPQGTTYVLIRIRRSAMMLRSR